MMKENLKKDLIDIILLNSTEELSVQSHGTESINLFKASVSRELISNKNQLRTLHTQGMTA